MIKITTFTKEFLTGLVQKLLGKGKRQFCGTKGSQTPDCAVAGDRSSIRHRERTPMTGDPIFIFMDTPTEKKKEFSSLLDLDFPHPDSQRTAHISIIQEKFMARGRDSGLKGIHLGTPLSED